MWQAIFSRVAFSRCFSFPVVKHSPTWMCVAACCTPTVTAWPGSSPGALSHPTEGDLLLHDDRRWALQRCMHALGAHARLGCPRACPCVAMPLCCGARDSCCSIRPAALTVSVRRLLAAGTVGAFGRREIREWPFPGVSHSTVVSGVLCNRVQQGHCCARCLFCLLAPCS